MNTPARLAVSLRTLLQGSLDYAGMFPPARLDLDDAWAKYLEAWASPHCWLLRSFVCPVGRLAELATWHGRSPAPQGRFTAIGTPPATGGESASAGSPQDDAARLADFYRQLAVHSGPPIQLGYEVSPPADATAEQAAWEKYCLDLDARLRAAGVPLSEVFLEVPLDLPWLASLEFPAVDSPWRWGLKFRTGGLEAAAFPTAEALAAAIASVAARAVTPGQVPRGNSPSHTACPGVVFKATAGLHHPLPHDVPDLACTMHGFINLFVASVVAWIKGQRPLALSGTHTSSAQRAVNLPSLLSDVLRERDPQAFAWDAHQLSWRGHHASLAAIANARRHSLVSFGSCSFDEPIADLSSLGWI